MTSEDFLLDLMANFHAFGPQMSTFGVLLTAFTLVTGPN